MKKEILNSNEQKAVGLYLKKLKGIFGPRLLLTKLYGSIVRGERWEESDLDILVLIKNLTWEEKRKVWDEATLLNIEWNVLLSPLVMTPEEFQELRDRERRIALDVDREGVEL